MELTKTVTHQGEQYIIKPLRGEFVNGELNLDAISIGERELEVNDVKWDDIENNLLGPLLYKLDNDPNQVQTCTEEYDGPRLIKEDSKEARILIAVCKIQPTTNLQLSDYIESDASPTTSTMKKKGLIQCVGYYTKNPTDGSKSKVQVFVATPLGVKEASCIMGSLNPFTTGFWKGEEPPFAEEEESGIQSIVDFRQEKEE